MGIPINLEEAEALYGLERMPKRKRRERKYKAVGMARKRCLHCNKIGYYTEESARVIIGRMLHNGTLTGPDAYTFRPYLCTHGFWHTGHDAQSRRWVEAKLEADARKAAAQTAK